MPEDPQKPVPVPVDHFIAGDARKGIAVAGLLASDPDLVGAEKLPAQWQKALDAYLKTPIDPPPGDPAGELATPEGTP